jgi:2-polyprenyl-6-hydroxyphenyl methylase/3-demethylubiquinone-9 3-methyltransferase
MTGYYSENLAAERLRRCYDIAAPPVRAYLEAEIDHLISKVSPTGATLELGCGYGRVLRRIAAHTRRPVGIDTSLASLGLAHRYLAGVSCSLIAMNASRMGFPDRVFDCAACIQNGISAFGIDPVALVREAVRVTKPDGRVLFSSYSDRFWNDRLAWFEQQADEGLLGPIDYERTGNGVIVCKDGFRASTIGPDRFRQIGAEIGIEPEIYEVAGSSLFCEFLII